MNKPLKSYRRKDHEKEIRMKRIQEKWERIIKISVDAAEGKLQVLNEMAIPLKSFLERIESVHPELIKNWCLCKWCQMFEPHHKVFNQWKKELTAFIDYLKTPIPKNKIDKKNIL